MPTYEYKCAKCGHVFEAVQSIMDAPLTHCPKCKGKVRRIIYGGMGVIFKGSGFYSTDNKKSSALTGGNGSKEKTAEKQPETGAAPAAPAEAAAKKDPA